jgi:hypothetical protein
VRALEIWGTVSTRGVLLRLSGSLLIDSVLVSSLVPNIVLAGRSVSVEPLSQHIHGSGRSSVDGAIACPKCTLCLLTSLLFAISLCVLSAFQLVHCAVGSLVVAMASLTRPLVF